jgi:ubiquitin-protein ligase E3 D
MLTPRPLIYAELLSNIRQISIIAALDSPCDSTTKAELTADGHQIILHHGGIVTSLALPGQVPQAAQLQNPVLGSKELSWRLPVALPAQCTRSGLEDAQKNDAPWSAKSLGEDAEFSCRTCGAVLLKGGSIRIWKDLPSENWAEMMDFWHCHKPDVHEPNDSSGHESHVDESGPVASKGYGADTKFAATPTVGFVDITTFLLANSDCSSLQVRKCFSLI